MSDNINTTPEVEKQNPKVSLTAKIFIAVLGVIILFIVGTMVYRNVRWKYELDVRYLGYEDGVRAYEITNNSKRILKDVVVTFEVDGILNLDFDFEYPVGRIEVGETITVKLRHETLKEVAAERDYDLVVMKGVGIAKIKYD